MTSRLIITGKNCALPNDAAQSCEGRIGLRYVVCPDCCGDGWVHGWENNPSAKPFQATCRYCDGHGAIPKKNKVGAAPPSRDKVARSVALPFDVERAAPVYDLTAGRWITLPSRMTRDAAVSAEPGRSDTTKHTRLFPHPQRPAEPPSLAAGRLREALDFAVTVAGLTLFGLIASFFLVMAQ